MTAPVPSGLRRARLPASVNEARLMIAYNEWILATSQSPQRRDRAVQMLANLRPQLARLDAAESAARSLPSAPHRTVVINGEEYEVVWP